MKRNTVKSSNIKTVGYNTIDQILEVEFNTGSIYHYTDVPEVVYNNLMKADSLGSFFNRQIKHSFKFIKGVYQPKDIIPNIYICGKAGAGKTLSARYLIEKCGFVQAKFAYPVYGIAEDYFGMTNKDRALLQTIGSDVGRDMIEDNIWVDRFIEDTKIVQLTREKMGLPPVGLVGDDTRFINEHRVLKDNGWVGIFLNVSDDIRIQRLGKRDGSAQVGTLNHASELSVDAFKDELIQFDASGTLEEMYTQFDALLNEITNRGKS